MLYTKYGKERIVHSIRDGVKHRVINGELCIIRNSSEHPQDKKMLIKCFRNVWKKD